MCMCHVPVQVREYMNISGVRVQVQVREYTWMSEWSMCVSARVRANDVRVRLQPRSGQRSGRDTALAVGPTIAAGNTAQVHAAFQRGFKKKNQKKTNLARRKRMVHYRQCTCRKDLPPETALRTHAGPVLAVRHRTVCTIRQYCNAPFVRGMQSASHSRGRSKLVAASLSRLEALHIYIYVLAASLGPG